MSSAKHVGVLESEDTTLDKLLELYQTKAALVMLSKNNGKGHPSTK